MSAKALNYCKGRKSENEAKEYLIKKGFIFIESNFEVDNGEIDLIMSDKDWLVFVEVKYKSNDYMGYPEDMIDKRKIAQVKRIAQFYLLKNPNIERKFGKYRIDAVCILGDKITHYVNIYA